MKPAAPRRRPEIIVSSGNGRSAGYRWEFLRRNPQYRADYEEFMGCFGAWLKSKGSWPHDATYRASWLEPDQEYFRTKVEPLLTELCRKWQVSDLFPPDFDDEEFLRADNNYEPIPVYPPTRASLSPHFSSDSELASMGFAGTGTITKRYKNVLVMQVDLNSPMKDLLDHTSGILKFALMLYRKEMNAQGVRLPKGRRRFGDYALHLRVWDLKQEGKRNTEIARLVFPKLSIQSGLSRVRDHLKAARKLISGHYREIR